MQLPLEAENHLGQQPVRKPGPQSHEHMEVNSATGLNEFKWTLLRTSNKAGSPADTLIFTLSVSKLSSQLSPICSSDLQNCETINLCCFKPNCGNLLWQAQGTNTDIKRYPLIVKRHEWLRKDLGSFSPSFPCVGKKVITFSRC